MARWIFAKSRGDRPGFHKVVHQSRNWAYTLCGMGICEEVDKRTRRPVTCKVCLLAMKEADDGE